MQQEARVLVVDDEESLRLFFRMSLEAAGYDVVCAEDGRQAHNMVVSQSYDVIISDISMPGMDGIELLRAVRAHDLDVPVILVTGVPQAKTAIQAVEYGAYRYLTKPVELDDLHATVRHALRAHELSRVRRDALALMGHSAAAAGDRAGLEASLNRALRTMWLVYQPIVSCSKRQVHGYEALLRCGEAPLQTPVAMLKAAERLGTLHQVGRTIRICIAEAIPGLPGDELMFVNVHPHDLLDDDLYTASSPLARHSRRVALEITERASLDEVHELAARIEALRKLGFKVAVDDFGAGYSGLSSFFQLDPDIVKIDMALVRDIHVEPRKQKVVSSMLELCFDMGVQVVVEGVESRQERDTLTGLGADLLQGYVFSHPAASFIRPSASTFAG